MTTTAGAATIPKVADQLALVAEELKQAASEGVVAPAAVAGVMTWRAEPQARQSHTRAYPAVSQLTCGTPGIVYHGGLLNTRVFHFDPANRKPGLPNNVAALVHKVSVVSWPVLIYSSPILLRPSLMLTVFSACAVRTGLC